MTDSRKLQFCNFRSHEFEGIHRQISSVFQISSERLRELYQKMGDDFEKDYWPPTNFVPRDCFLSEDDQFQAICEQSPSIGIDLPSFLELNDGNENKPTIVLLGQDPKRGSDDVEISIGTPYGLHLRKSREEPSSTRLYFKMIHVLMRLGYRVYLTDVFKIWVCNPDHRYKGTKLPKLDKQQCLNALEAEITAVKPAAVITWGSPARAIVKKMEVGLHLSFPHPSGAASGAWKRLMGQSPTHTNKLAHWERNVTHALYSRDLAFSIQKTRL